MLLAFKNDEWAHTCEGVFSGQVEGNVRLKLNVGDSDGDSGQLIVVVTLKNNSVLLQKQVKNVIITNVRSIWFILKEFA